MTDNLMKGIDVNEDTLMVDEIDAVGRKLTEEATEVLLAAKDHAAGSGRAERVAEEAADLVYHLLVLLAERDLSPTDVSEVLEARAR